MAGKALSPQPTIDATAERLLRLAWWDWDHDMLHSVLPDFRKLSVEEFLDKYDGSGDCAPANPIKRSAIS